MSLLGYLGYYGIDAILQQWADMGVFEFALPFMLVFAVVFGVLSTIKLFGENKGINAVIAMVAGLMAITSESLRSFFSTIFPYLGIGLLIFLVILILVGLVMPAEKGWFVALTIIGLLIGLIVVFTSLTSSQWLSSYWWEQYGGLVILAIVFGGMIAAIIASRGKKGGGKSEPFQLIAWRPEE